MPLLYLLPLPWAIRGIEEARVYAVLVGQCILRLVPLFLFRFRASAPSLPQDWGLFGHFTAVGLVILILLIQIWGALSMVRGWKEHREYLAILRSMPRES
ncbi:hypothetical protein [Geothrix sp.]|uniref:hypothetical protein n=1 Tax=Geothrix sp. TaxID=1962974 RepID=UPI0025C40B94|nr:hypothetical protein [Geothrix sp.]